MRSRIFPGFGFAPSLLFMKKPKRIHENTYTLRRTSRSTTTVTFDELLKIVIVLDESGSMGPVKHQIIKSLNELISEQEEISERPATFTLVKFNNDVKRVMVNKLLTNINPLSYQDYQPDGSTALYDAIGDTIEWFRNEKDVLMIIVTDGEENASTEYTKSKVKELIDQKKIHNNWTYVYLSPNRDTEMQGNEMGLGCSNCVSNCCVDLNDFGNFIGKELNSAIREYRQEGISVQSQLNWCEE
jgi:hypothetical protein